LGARSSAGRVRATVAPGRERSDLRGRQGPVLAASGSVGTGLRAALPQTQHPARRQRGFGSRRFPVPIPALPPGRLRDLGQVISPPPLFLRLPRTRVKSFLAPATQRFRATVPRGSAPRSPIGVRKGRV